VKLTRLARASALSLPVLGALLTCPSTFAADDFNYAQLLEQKAPTVVTLKFVLKIRMSMGGQSQDDEQNAEARGVVVDPSGLVMLSNDSLEAGGGMMRMMRRRPGADISSNPQDIKVLFGNDSKEHEALLVARDSKLGLAFVQILAPEGTLAAVDLGGKDVGVSVGQTLVGVTRKSRGFDSAPVFERTLVTGRIEKPRPMWALAGAAAVGLPLYDAQGRAVGVPSRQQGVEGADEGGGGAGGLAALLGGGDAGLFLLPLEAVGRVLEQAKKRVPEAVAKAKEAKEKDAAKPAEPAMDGGSPTPVTPASPGTPPTPTPVTPKEPDAPKSPDQPK
jgi:hypothetical protein